MSDGIRVDRWLWAVRLYKTRTQAAEACRTGHVRVSGDAVKPAREVHIGDTVAARTGEVTRTFKVRALLEARVGAARLPEYIEDLTPPEELARPRERAVRTLGYRLPGTGRPTKRERRRMESWIRQPPPEA